MMGFDRFTGGGSLGRLVARAAGVLGVALLAYSAGYTRGMIVERGGVVGKPASSVSVFAVGSFPDWVGVTGFVGIGLVALYVLQYVYVGRIRSADNGPRGRQ